MRASTSAGARNPVPAVADCTEMATSSPGSATPASLVTMVDIRLRTVAVVVAPMTRGISTSEVSSGRRSSWRDSLRNANRRRPMRLPIGRSVPGRTCRDVSDSPSWHVAARMPGHTTPDRRRRSGWNNLDCRTPRQCPKPRRSQTLTSTKPRNTVRTDTPSATRRLTVDGLELVGRHRSIRTTCRGVYSLLDLEALVAKLASVVAPLANPRHEPCWTH